MCTELVKFNSVGIHNIISAPLCFILGQCNTNLIPFVKPLQILAKQIIVNVAKQISANVCQILIKMILIC